MGKFEVKFHSPKFSSNAADKLNLNTSQLKKFSLNSATFRAAKFKIYAIEFDEVAKLNLERIYAKKRDLDFKFSLNFTRAAKFLSFANERGEPK